MRTEDSFSLMPYRLSCDVIKVAQCEWVSRRLFSGSILWSCVTHSRTPLWSVAPWTPRATVLPAPGASLTLDLFWAETNQQSGSLDL